ncbi:hypothetical protein KCU99_g9751, partial [Aureobasidium melanogenum]
MTQTCVLWLGKGWLLTLADVTTRKTHQTNDSSSEICKEQTADDEQKELWRPCKTYSSRDSHVVTHRSTNLPFNCLCMAERTGCPVFS